MLRLAVETKNDWTERAMVMVAGIARGTSQARAEARIARDLGYHVGLVSLAAFQCADEDTMVAHYAALADEIPIFGFYLQPAVGGVRLTDSFWRRFAEIENAVGIKVAPFDRYATQAVVRKVVAARAEERVVLYTGNDDHIVLDLVTPFGAVRDGKPVMVRFRGGLLGQWAVWTRRAVQLLERIHQGTIDDELLTLDWKLTDANRAIFDVANGFRGCIAGCHEVLRRQGRFEGIWCLDPDEDLSPRQAEDIDRVCRDHPELADDEFVADNLDRWLAGDASIKLRPT